MWGDSLPTYCVSYDLADAKPEEYAELITHLKSYTTWWHHLESTWFIVADTSVSSVRDACKRVAPSGSKILVFSIGDNWAGKGFSERAYTWLKSNWDRE